MPLVSETKDEKVILVFTPNQEVLLRQRMLKFAAKTFPGSIVRSRGTNYMKKNDLEQADIVVVVAGEGVIGPMYAEAGVRVVDYVEEIASPRPRASKVTAIEEVPIEVLAAEQIAAAAKESVEPKEPAAPVRRQPKRT